MYISQKNYKITGRINEESQSYKLVVILPSDNDGSRHMERFEELINECAACENVNKKWEVIVLNHKNVDRTPEKNYISIYYADAIVIECSKKKPNIFYMLGLAHASGRPVCACYLDSDDIEIPFNVHGRQSMTYSINSSKSQNVFKEDFIGWLNKL